MANKRSQQSVPATEQGRVPGDASGQRNFMRMPEGSLYTDGVKKGSHARGGGPAPKPRGGAKMLGHDRPTAGVQASLARVPASGGAAAAGNFLPVRKPSPGLANQRVGQANPGSFTPRSGPGIRVAPVSKAGVDGGPLASRKPKRKGLGAAFYGEY